MIKNSEWIGKHATTRDVGNRTGVLVTTISGAFSGNRRMAQQTRITVLSTAWEWSYEHNPHSQRQRKGAPLMREIKSELTEEKLLSEISSAG